MRRAPERRASNPRDDALSRARIVDAAIALLDAEGENGLTFRALAARLSTGSGAIYWHIANKSELLVAACDAVVIVAMDEVAAAAPHMTIRGIAVRLFDAIDAHPWVAAQLFRAPTETSMLQIFERIGREIQALGVPDGAAQFTAASALVSYIIGVSGQNAVNGRVLGPNADRGAFLGTVAARWKALDPHAYPFTRHIAVQLREHDDRAELVAGIDLILAGVAASR